MTSQSGGHAEKPGPTSSRPPAAPKLQVQRSLSRETITIHFSALGKEEEEEEEELYGAAISSAPAPAHDDQSIVTALEASEDLLFEGGPARLADVAVLAVSSTTTLPAVSGSASASAAPSPALSILAPSLHSTGGSATASSSWPSGQKDKAPPPGPPSSASSSSSPSRSVAPPPGDRPFASLVKSLSTDVEPREGVTLPPAVRHRHLMKTLVKSLSTDTSRQDQDTVSYRTPDSRLNLQLFKQFTQPRVTVAGDSKTAPSSPLASPDNRSFFKVSEVEARIEDTRRRLSEVIYEPLQLLSKIMGDESGGGGGGGGGRTPGQSAVLQRLGALQPGRPQRPPGEQQQQQLQHQGGGVRLGGRGPAGQRRQRQRRVARPRPVALASQARGHRQPSLALDKCSMSALARQEDEEFCELYSEDFEVYVDAETDGEAERAWDAAPSAASLPPSASTEAGSEDETEEEEEPGPSVPHKTLLALTTMVYGYFVLPLPTYVGGMLLGVAMGFMLAIGVVWMAAPRRSGCGSRQSGRKDDPWNLAHLDIKEPGIFKGWMNEILNYDPETYHATLTHSVFVRLEGATLRLSKPNRNVARRATFNEPKPDVTYVSQKIYDLTDSKICLVPESLARKRVWNKKYPICIELGKQEDFMSKAQADKAEATEEKAAAAERPEAAGGGEETLFLFGRTGREKEEWFRRILVASRLKSEAKKASGLPGAVLTSQSRSSSRGSLDEALAMMSQPRQKELTATVKQKMLLDYSVYMAKYVLPAPGSPATSPVHSAASSPGATKKTSTTLRPGQLPSSPGAEEEPVAWVNALVGRIFWDFLGEKYWADMVSKKIQMKLSKIRLPYFMNELTLTELDMGVAIPKILLASKPSVDHQGLWFDLEISYNGSFLMTLETKMNLARLGKEGRDCALVRQARTEVVKRCGCGYGVISLYLSSVLSVMDRRALTSLILHRPRTYCLADSDEESSSAGSSDEEDPPEIAPDKNVLPGAEGYVGGHKPSKIMRFVDKITKSKYFQKATETEFIKKKMEEVSNTPCC
ncbi:hypothetical protein AAFF_G00407520 [Aldrovandia affinis]|uniref:SMP-LTD domain-containing protein n=1 Tax=Aldrovandia affinis TaxID=143900 RepID=A0AAD7SBN4_9TELE|nr:hypothetical protein AAFF_G00407520 [Aldrovandia affinis]